MAESQATNTGLQARAPNKAPPSAGCEPNGTVANADSFGVDFDSHAKPAGLIWLESILSPVIEVSIFGGSILFSVVVGDQDFTQAKRLQAQLPRFLALAWLFFVIALGSAIATKMALPFAESAIVEAFKESQNRKPLAEAHHSTEEQQPLLDTLARLFIVKLKIADILCLLVLLAFFFMSLCVAAYSPGIGAVAAGFSGCMCILFCVTWTVQNWSTLAQAVQAIGRILGRRTSPEQSS